MPPALPRPPTCTCALTTTRAADALGRGARLLRRLGRLAGRHRDAVAREELLALVLEEIHLVSLVVIPGARPGNAPRHCTGGGTSQFPHPAAGCPRLDAGLGSPFRAPTKEPPRCHRPRDGVPLPQRAGPSSPSWPSRPPHRQRPSPRSRSGPRARSTSSSRRTRPSRATGRASERRWGSRTPSTRRRSTSPARAIRSTRSTSPPAGAPTPSRARRCASTRPPAGPTRMTATWSSSSRRRTW